uniref:MYND-type domain-containing protein n=1 Tax=Caenorhabditis japonica TaxID=281687 RepID=A0A8R1E3S6_CAEJA
MTESSSHEEMMLDEQDAPRHHHNLVPIDKEVAEAFEQRQQQDGPPQYNSQIVITDAMKRLVIDLQRHWLTDYHNSRQKCLVDLTEKMHQEFLEDQQKVREELMQQFKEELEQTRADLESKYHDNLKAESVKLVEKHQKELAQSKKKQWCWSCENEAIYHCCWNTAYCSVECQQGHWSTHRKFCRRKKAGAGAPGNSGAAHPPAAQQL